MSIPPRAGKRAILLAILLPTTTLCLLGAKAQDAQAVILPAIEVTSPLQKLSLARQKLYEQPTGQAATTIPRDHILTDSKAFTVTDVLRYSPGVSMKASGGPRDVGISIRGSNTRSGCCTRNIVLFDDGFRVTPPSGLSRADLFDPHAYGAIDVIRGPSSALFGNYAIGGAVNFRLRTGREINGIDFGTDAGSFGYLNNYTAYGSYGENWDASVFFSNIIGNGPAQHNLYNTQTLNFLITYEPTPNDRFYVKGINNTLYADTVFRLTLDQFYRSPYQNNCYGFGAGNATTQAGANAARAAADAAGCATNQFFVNGFTGLQVPLTPYESGAHLHDRLSTLGLRWEHDLDNDTLWRTQAILNDKTINQPFGAASGISGLPAFDFTSDLTSRGTIVGFDATHFVGIFVNTETTTFYRYNVKVGGNGAVGGLASVTPSRQTNMGLRGREEVRLTDTLTAVAGLGVEYTQLDGSTQAFSYATTNGFITQQPGPVTSATNAYYNIAPEGALLWQPSSEWQVRGRVGTAYATPNAGNLFVLPTGLPGNNTSLKTQTTVSFDLGVTWRPWQTVFLDVTGFYELVRNELVTQSPGPSPLLPFTFNAPRAEHRGIEVAGLWEFSPGWKFRAIYTYLNQIYTDYNERLSVGTGAAATSSSFDRAGHWIPGVSPNELTLRLGYDQPDGPAKGLGAFAEYLLTDSFYIDNANLLKVPGFLLVNLNIHYDTEIANSFIRKIGAFFEVRNLFDRTNIVGATNITNTLDPVTGAENPRSVLAASGVSITAGYPRTFVGGFKVRF
jgi:iron complex outermembrane receptor protein